MKEKPVEEEKGASPLELLVICILSGILIMFGCVWFLAIPISIVIVGVISSDTLIY